MAEKYALSEVIFGIREELLRANEIAIEQKKAVMQFDECEIEFAVEVEKSGEAGIAIHFLTLGGGVKKSEHNTVKVKFKAVGTLVAAVGSGGKPSTAYKRQTGRKDL